MMGTALGIGSSQLGQPNPWGFSPYGGQWIGSHPLTQQLQPYGQPPQLVPFAGYGAGNYPFGLQTAQYAQPLQQIQQLQQQLLAQQTPFGAATPGLAGLTMSQPFGVPFAWSATAQGVPPVMAPLPFGVTSATGQVM